MPLGHDPPDPDRSLISGKNIIVTGGNITSFQNVYYGPAPKQQLEVFDRLCPNVGPPRIDGRLFHDSMAYEHLRMSSANSAVDSFSEEMINELADGSTNIHHESYHPFWRNHSRAMALFVAQLLAARGVLLASIILPSSSHSYTTRRIAATLAYQLAQNIPATAEYILAAIQRDTAIFERNTETQFTQLIRDPLRLASKGASLDELAKWPSTIVIDGNAHQFSPGSVPHQVIQLVGSLSDIDSPGIHISLILTSSTTLFDKRMVITLALQRYAGRPVFYFTWRIYE